MNTTQKLVMITLCSLVLVVGGCAASVKIARNHESPAMLAQLKAEETRKAYAALDKLTMEVTLTREDPSNEREYAAFVDSSAGRIHYLNVYLDGNVIASITQREEAWIHDKRALVPTEVFSNGTVSGALIGEKTHTSYILTKHSEEWQKKEIVLVDDDKRAVRWISDSRHTNSKGCMFGSLKRPWIGPSEPPFQTAMKKGIYRGKAEVNGLVCDLIVWDRVLGDGIEDFRRVDYVYTDPQTHLLVRVFTEQYDLPENKLEIWGDRVYRVIHKAVIIADTVDAR